MSTKTKFNLQNSENEQSSKKKHSRNPIDPRDVSSLKYLAPEQREQHLDWQIKLQLLSIQSLLLQNPSSESNSILDLIFQLENVYLVSFFQFVFVDERSRNEFF